MRWIWIESNEKLRKRVESLEMNGQTCLHSPSLPLVLLLLISFLCQLKKSSLLFVMCFQALVF